MAIVARLLNTFKRQSKTLEEKISELSQLSMQELSELLHSDQPDTIKAAALELLDYSPQLTSLAFTGADTAMQHKARVLIAKFIDDGSVSVGQLHQDTGDTMLLLSILGFCKKTAVYQELINESTDAPLLHKVAVEGVSIKIRKLAAEKLEDEAFLKLLLKETKGKDKLIYNIAKEKCDALNQQQKRAEQRQLDSNRFCHLLEAHSKRPFDNLFIATTNKHKEKWQVLNDNSALDLISRVNTAFELCDQTLEHAMLDRAKQEAKDKAIANADSLHNDIINQLRQLLTTTFEYTAFDATLKTETQDTLTSLHKTWVESNNDKPASSHNRKNYEQLCDAINNELQKIENTGPLSEQLVLANKFSEMQDLHINKKDHIGAAEISMEEKDRQSFYQLLSLRVQSATLLDDIVPSVIIDINAAIAARNKQVAVQRATEKNLLKHIGALINQANTAISSGHSKQAAGIRRTIESKVPTSLPSYLSSQLEQLDTDLGKLLDWKSYAVEPKKHALIERMQLLTVSKEPPEALATKIKRLQEEWKALSQGSHDQDLWESFHELAQVAYQPCKIYFENQAAVRLDNLDKRKILVSQLKEYVASQHWDEQLTAVIDWSAVQTLVATAVKEWRHYSPVDRNANQPIQREFDKYLDLIRDKLNAQFQKNSDSKREIIQLAKNLAHEDDNRIAVDKVKKLQVQWKAVGYSSRMDDQKLWTEFRACCDVIFDKRQQQTKQFKFQINENKKLADTLCREVLSLSELLGADLIKSSDRINEIQQEFNQIGELPKVNAQQTKQAFFKAIDQFQSNIVVQRKKVKEQVWIDLLEAANRIRLFQLASDEDAILLKTEARLFIDAVKHWPKNGLAAVEDKISSFTDVIDTAENEQKLREICVKAEILADQPTPDADKPLRMQQQVKRLEKGLGQNTIDKVSEINSLVFEWVAVMPVTSETYEILLHRFIQCRS
jgi:hypothetical protein